MKTLLILLFACIGGMIYQYKYSKSKNYQEFRKLGFNKNVKSAGFFGAAMALAPKAISIGKSLFGGSKGGANMTMQQLIAMKNGQSVPNSVKAPQSTSTGQTIPLNPNINPNAGSKFLGMGTTWFQRNWKQILLWGVLPLTVVVGGIIYFVKRGKGKKSFK